jgi:hypothetical protein
MARGISAWWMSLALALSLVASPTQAQKYGGTLKARRPPFSAHFLSAE